MSKGANNTYFGNIKEAVNTLWYGLRLTLRHFWQARRKRAPIGIESVNYFEQKDGIVTLQYPRESLPVPDNARYRLHNEIEDCIVCDKCAKICPVNCIEIEPIRAIDEDLGRTSDGTPKRIYAAKFDIDMGKCCFCGLCTTVCPTECLTMTKAYDFSEFDVADHNYAFGEMTPLEILEKSKKLEEYNANKASTAKKPASASSSTASKPSFKPRVAAKPVNPEKVQDIKESDDVESKKKTKPVFKPKVKPTQNTPVEKNLAETSSKEEASKSSVNKPVFRPKIKQVDKQNPEENKTENASPSSSPQAKPKFRPKIKPVTNPLKEGGKEDETSKEKGERERKDKNEKPEEKSGNEAQKEKPKPVFRPKIKPRNKED